MAILATTSGQFKVGTTSATPLTDTYVPIGEIRSFGDFGDKTEIITFQSLSDNRVRKAAGVADSGDVEIEFAYDPADAGQTALKAAQINNNQAYNFEVALNDDIGTGAGHKPTRFHFKAIVTSFNFAAGATNEFVIAKATLAITTAITLLPQELGA